MKHFNFVHILLGSTITANLASCASQAEPPTAPNILLVVFDDLGFSDLQPFGGEINTPVINTLAEQGKMFTRFHTSPLSAPSRSLLLTGVDNHRNGLGSMPSAHFSNQYMQPGYEGYLTDNVMTIPEILSSQGYYTCMSGKWHLGCGKHDPYNRGFNDTFALMGGGASHYSNAFSLSDGEEPVTYYTENGKKIDKLPDDFYSSKSYANKMIEYIDKCPASTPLFGYLAFTSGHDPLHVPEDWVDKYNGYYDEGYESIRRSRYERQIASGIISSQTKLNHSSEEAKVWDKLSDQEKQLQIKKMEVYAAMIEYVDMSLGRVIEKLKSSGRYENTIIFVMTDNGANPHESWMYPGSNIEYINKRFNNSIENIGSADSYVSLGQSWAEITNTPYSLFKHTTMEGGICTPLIVWGPGIEQGVLDAHNTLHVTDILPTILEYTSCTRPTHLNGVELTELYGKSLTSVLSNNEKVLRDDNEALCFEMV